MLGSLALAKLKAQKLAVLPVVLLREVILVIVKYIVIKPTIWGPIESKKAPLKVNQVTVKEKNPSVTIVTINAGASYHFDELKTGEYSINYASNINYTAEFIFTKQGRVCPKIVISCTIVD